MNLHAGGNSPRSPLRAVWLGQMSYREASALQVALRNTALAGKGEWLLGLEHPPVVTLGRRAVANIDVANPERLRAAGIDVIESSRGGGATFHGPGQLIVYSVVRVNGLVAHVHKLADSCTQLLAKRGVEAEFSRCDPGVWVKKSGDRKKIASIGLHLHRRVTTHGMAVNISCDLSPFDWIIPCQTPGLRMTSLLNETGRHEALAALFHEVAAFWAAPVVSPETLRPIVHEAAQAQLTRL